MRAINHAVYAACAAAILGAGCATSPEVQDRRDAIAADIAEILSQPLDVAEYGNPRQCISDHEIYSYRALDDRHLLFEGRGDRMWVNTLRMTCPDLQYGDVLVIRKFSSTRLCDADMFEVADWFAWPWYRRWPWHWSMNWGVGVRCSLGTFHPVSQAQIDEIEAVLRSR
jgi:hypothetical protein